jgi:hypothetical protein
MVIPWSIVEISDIVTFRGMAAERWIQAGRRLRLLAKVDEQQ